MNTVLQIRAHTENRYDSEGVSFEYNPFVHGYYPVSGWMYADDFEKMVQRFRASGQTVVIVWGEPQ